jgi:glutamine synthetase
MGMAEQAAALAQLREQWPQLEYVEAWVSDVNGIARGKRLPASELERLYAAGLNLPASTLLLDVWGNEVPATGLVFDSGDADYPCHPVGGPLPAPWSQGRGAQVLLGMHTPGGGPWAGDPRQVLASASERLYARGLTPVIATELEFRLFAGEPGARGEPVPPPALAGHGVSQLLGLDELDSLGEVFRDIEQACRAQALPADTIIAEQSAGQYEVNLRHVADPLRAADHAILLKRTIKAVARRHGLLASFMAKPFGDQAGNGLHVHASLVDDTGANALAGEGDAGVSEALRHAVGGLTATMAEAMAVFAPHANSYRRFQADAHVPMAPTWGLDNRTTAVRVPLSSPSATRLEHRVAGADANPYLVLAAVLAGIDHGLAHAIEPPPATAGAAETPAAARLPLDWYGALASFAGSPFIADYLGADYRRLFTACKEQEQGHMRRHVPPIEYETGLGTV